MDNETREAINELRGAMTALGERLVKQESQILDFKPPETETKSPEETGAKLEQETPSIVSSTDTARLQELEGQVSTLTDEIEAYQSPDYSEELIRRWARGLTPESYIALGVKLGFQNVLAEEAADPGILNDQELKLEEDGPAVAFSQVIPEGEDGWIKSETLDCFVKVQ